MNLLISFMIFYSFQVQPLGPSVGNLADPGLGICTVISTIHRLNACAIRLDDGVAA